MKTSRMIALMICVLQIQIVNAQSIDAFARRNSLFDEQSPAQENAARAVVDLQLPAFPTSLCPGDCFTTTATFSPISTGSFDTLAIFSDFPSDVTVTISDPTGVGALSTGIANTYAWPPSAARPAHYQNFASTGFITIQICIGKGRTAPVNLGFHLTRGTDTDVEIRTIAVANVPNYKKLELKLESPADGSPLSEICSGEPIKFCIRDQVTGLPVAAPPPGTVVLWEIAPISTGIFTPLTDPAFSLNQFCFNVPRGVLSANCAPGASGRDRFEVRAIVSTTDPITGANCHYTVPAAKLNICCPVPPLLVRLDDLATGTIPGVLCEGDVVTVGVKLIPSVATWFPGTSSSVVTIDWCLNGVPITVTSGTPTAFNYGPFTVGTTDLCFEAKVKNCACPEVRASECIEVDPVPKCGQIIGCDPADLTLTASSPMLCYDICPGRDAEVCMVNPADFKDGIVQWQFSFNNTTWVNLGSSNPRQNTNTLPCDDTGSPYLWAAGQTCIYYRICVMPYSAASGCDPCYSNTIKICLRKRPDIPILGGVTTICQGGTAIIDVLNPEAGVTYQWYCNGVPVGAGGISFFATQQACYWVVASNGCETVKSSLHCLKVCEVTALISCPLTPNECAEVGVEIQLDCSASSSSCGGALMYSWSDDGTGTPGTTSSATTNCAFYHFPATGGTTYTLTVTDANTCTSSTTITVVPCTP
jgi:hypothetical protein